MTGPPERERGRRRRRSRVTWRLLLTLGLALGVAAAALILWAEARARHAVLPANVGNFERVRTDYLRGGPVAGRYKFGVIGDTKNTGTCERIVAVLGNEPLAFLVYLGDFVDDSLIAEHRFFALETSELALPYPVFLAVGNHDVGKEFSLADFERCYGPAQFSFRYGPDLFIVLLYISDYPTAPAMAFLEEVLKRERASARYAFVFTHAPPVLADEDVGKAGPLPGDLIRLAETHRVNYVISGNLHGYRRIERNGVRYLVSGGGGARLYKGVSQYGQFHHGVVLEPGPEGVIEQVLPIVPTFLHTAEDRVERWAVVRAGPWLRRHWYLASIGGAVWLAAVVLAWRSVRGSRAGPAGPQGPAR